MNAFTSLDKPSLARNCSSAAFPESGYSTAINKVFPSFNLLHMTASNNAIDSRVPWLSLNKIVSAIKVSDPETGSQINVSIRISSVGPTRRKNR